MKIQMIRLMTYLAAAVSAALFSLAASALPSRPEPARLVNDLAGLFSLEQRESLEKILVAFDDSTSNQIAVITVEDLEGYAPSEYATRIGIDWGVGSADFNNGIVILVKPKNTSSGQVFIAIGYGLEGAIPDAYAKRIINNEMIPHFIENDYYRGVEAACGTLMQLASGEISATRTDGDGDPIWMLIVFLIAVFIIVIILIAANNDGSGNNSRGNRGNRNRSILDGPIITIGNDFGGWGKSSGGSFGGFGGGGFGGFGGFGGGSFGGGGAGGSW